MSRSSTYRFFALLLAAFASAGMFSAQMSFAAEPAAKADRVEAVLSQPAAKATLSREASASVKQLSQDLAKQLMNPRPGQEPLVHAMPNAQQMQQSLEAYLRAIAAKLLGGGGNGESDNGMCMTAKMAVCKPGDVEVGSDLCEGKGKATCSKGAIVRCQDAVTLKGYSVTTSCKWMSLP